MKPKTPPSHKQGNFLYQDLLEQLNPKNPLLMLARKIPWEIFDCEFSKLYAEHGRPGKPIRLMVGLLLLKQIENLSDERVVEAWVRNPYYQAFCGSEHFQWRFPCDPSELVHFRKRIGESGVEKYFRYQFPFMVIEHSNERSLSIQLCKRRTLPSQQIQNYVLK